MPLNKSWHEYNESLIERGRILMDIGFLRSSTREIRNVYLMVTTSVNVQDVRNMILLVHAFGWKQER